MCIGDCIVDIRESIQATKTENAGQNTYVLPRIVKINAQNTESFIRDKAEAVNSDNLLSLPDDAEDRLHDVDLKGIISDDSKKGAATLLYGRAGVGKTSLARRAMHEWSERRWGMGYTLMFLLDMHEQCDVITMSHEALIENSVYKFSRHHPQLPLWMENNEDRMLIWFGKYMLMFSKYVT